MRVAGRQIRRCGILFIVSGPSGAGKTSICGPLLERVDGLELSVSTTTRKPRSGERDHVDYHFVDDGEFDSLTAAGAFAEWAEVHGHRYGTPRARVDDALAGGRDMLLDIDVHGAALIKERYAQSLSIFLCPPSRACLEERLAGRGTDSTGSVRHRLRNACAELAALLSYDHVLVNERLEETVERFIAIIHAERSRVVRLCGADLEAVIRAFGGER